MLAQSPRPDSSGVDPGPLRARRPCRLGKAGCSTTTFTYDSLNNPASQALPTGATGYLAYANGQAMGGQSCASSDSGHPYLAKCAMDAQSNMSSFSYDGPGNLLTNASAKAGLQQTNTYNPTTPTCGGKPGQLCSTTNGNGNKTSYTYDSVGNLAKVTPPAPLGSTTTVVDSLGRPVSVTDGKGQVTRTTYNVNDQVTQVLTGGATTCSYAAGTWGAEGELVAIEQGGAMYYPHADLRGDIVSVTDANANVVATYSYGPWGELMSQTGSFNQPWRYAGYYQDSETGLYYLQQRYYNPNLSRFLSPEPNYSDFCANECGFDALVAKAPVTSTYAYANDRPTILVDGDGSWPHWGHFFSKVVHQGLRALGIAAYAPYYAGFNANDWISRQAWYNPVQLARPTFWGWQITGIAADVRVDQVKHDTCCHSETIWDEHTHGASNPFHKRNARRTRYLPGLSRTRYHGKVHHHLDWRW